MEFHCKFCPFCCSRWKEYMKHTFQCHSSGPNFKFNCGISGCIQTFRTYSAMSSHLVRKHSNFDFIQFRAVHDDTHTAMQQQPSTSEAPDNDGGEGLEEEFRYTDDHEDHLLIAKRSSALLLLSLKERHRLTQSAVNFSIGQIKEMMTHILDGVKASVKQCVGDIDVDRYFDVDPFEDLGTEYLQTKFYQEYFHLVEPVTIELGSVLVPVQTGSKRRLSNKKNTFQYIPLLEGLRSFLSNAEILDEILQEHNYGNGFIGDFCDGKLFKTHDLFKNNKKSLQIIAYFDEVEVCNPLAGHAGIHKLGMFYYVLGNLRPELRSTHRAIQLIACVECPDLRKYGFGNVLQPFIRDVNILCNDGITVTVNGQVHKFHGTVLLMLGDTLAAHDLGGFKVGVGFSLRICRDCMATKEMIQEKFSEEDFQLRDPISHDYHCSLLQGPFATADSTTYGVNSTSCLNQIEHFHVANFQMPQDIMHVILEGVLPLETRLMLASFIDDGLFTLDLLNQRVLNFTYSRVEARTKPPKQFEKSHFVGPRGRLHLSASQMWNFAILLPLMIGDKIEDDNAKWESFLLLVEITKICTARVTSTEAADYLSVLIKDHHQLFKSCYPSVSLTPKTHYMVHIPRLLTHVGPMVSTWCMRMEAKNSYFKRIAQIGNFKNLPLSVAKRHQRLLCAHLQGPFFVFDELESGPCKEVGKLSGDVFLADILDVLPGSDLDMTVSRPNWIGIYGEKYHRNEFVMVGFQDDDLPSFGRMIDIIVASGSIPLLAVDLYKTVGINTHVAAYQILRTNKKSFILLSHIVNKHPYSGHSYIGDGNTYIALRSHMPNC